jgi:DNA-binding GntR family transcriptional regulator
LYNDPQSYQDLYDQHLAIFKAIKERDPDGAYIKMLNHMHYIETEIKRQIGDHPKLRHLAYPLYKKG